MHRKLTIKKRKQTATAYVFRFVVCTHRVHEFSREATCSQSTNKFQVTFLACCAQPLYCSIPPRKLCLELHSPFMPTHIQEKPASLFQCQICTVLWTSHKSILQAFKNETKHAVSTRNVVATATIVNHKKCWKLPKGRFAPQKQNTRRSVSH